MTSNFAKSISIANTADVASHMTKPFLSSGIQFASGTRTPEVVPFQLNKTSLLKSIFDKSGNKP